MQRILLISKLCAGKTALYTQNYFHIPFTVFILKKIYSTAISRQILKKKKHILIRKSEFFCNAGTVIIKR